MNPDEKKLNIDKNKTTLSGVSANDWMKKLEAATGKPVELGGAPQASGAEAGANREQRTVQFRCAETGKPFFVHVDGELFDKPLNKLEVKVLPKRLEFFTP